MRLNYEVPYDSYTIIEYIIRPIGLNGGTVYISGLVSLVLFIIGLRGLFKLERFQNTSKILIFLGVVLIAIPVMQWTVDAGRTTFHRINGHELQGVDFVEGEISLSASDEELTIHSSLTIKDYSRRQNRFKVRLYLPESLQEVTGKEFYDFDRDYITYGNRGEKVITKQVSISLEDEGVRDDFFRVQWHDQDIQYKLYNEEESITPMNRGL
ncbi:hypothetical protein [Isachenkonia alkalipeptolytica]|uniref:Uncharacterized protein n=1 Tax=Isachenkonia alkalipeptolytica TaxID=2565777 RepID=A0AA43XIS3_9CLOT|nr:hypothetical protein [Isachenkonia alkalipeptolytica]NBG87226.1 hypothetical protein [Isachenkonia alkalipeptolytica]